MNKIGIYVHIPFCIKKCDYCDFISYENKEKYVEKYVQALKKEIEINKKENIVQTIYIGGGTPSSIESIYIIEILDKIKKEFNVDNEAEITIEINPGTVNEQKLYDYKKAGINRISIGMQACEDKMLKKIGRIHTYEQFKNTYNLARKIGFKNINIDAIIGLPSQTIKDIEKLVDEIISINPEHISVYSLILEEGTKLKEKVDRKEEILPEEEIERQMYWYVKKKLEENNYIHYEISNFSKKGFESKHNLDCWNQGEYIGFGVSAHSYYNSKRYSNIESIEEYIENIEKKEYNKNIIVHEIQKDEEKMKEFMLLGLRKIQGVNISDFKNKFIKNPIYEFRKELSKLEKEKLIEIDENNIKLTNKAIDLANIVWEEFI